MEWWKLNGDESSKNKIKRLLQEISEHPKTGTGKPEALSHNLAGLWSRRINKKDRIIYQIFDDRVLILVLSLRNHYSDR
ncbi:MAG: Txe/YoeB family addiction module toxin [Bacteroidales bacterium]|nr:Txe/YoeB family addiction module toxin [Bacteroidales bacterium]